MKVLPILLLTSCACAQTPPYPPSGFRPQEPFTLPPRQQPATFAPEVNQFGAREPQLQPQGQYLPPQSYRPALTTGLRPEEQYVPPRPFGGQQYFRPPSELELQISHVRALQNQNSIGTEEPRQPQTQYGAPTTEQNVPTQENFDDQRLRVNQQQQNRELGVQDEDRRPVVTRRVVQRRRKQQRGDQNRDVSEVSGLNNRPFNTYGVPTTARTVYLTRKTTGFRREPESTTRPAQQLRTTTVGTTEDETTDEEETETATGPNVSIATAVAGRYYLLQPNGQLQKLQVANIPENEEAAKLSARNHLLQNQNAFQEPIYTINAPLIRFNN